MKTFSAKPQEVERKWYVIDAADKAVSYTHLIRTWTSLRNDMIKNRGLAAEENLSLISNKASVTQQLSLIHIYRCIPIPCPFFMDEKPGIVKFTPPSTSRSALLIAVAVTVGVQVALCAVLVAIHLPDMWFPSVQGGEVEMTFVAPSEEVSQEMEEVQPTSVVPVAAPSTVSPVPEIASDEDLLAVSYTHL